MRGKTDLELILETLHECRETRAWTGASLIVAKKLGNGKGVAVLEKHMMTLNDLEKTLLRMKEKETGA